MNAQSLCSPCSYFAHLPLAGVMSWWRITTEVFSCAVLLQVMVEAFCAQHAASRYPSPSSFRIFDRESPVVSTQSCFDDLLVPPDHVSRSLSDTYYINHTTVASPRPACLPACLMLCLCH